MIYEQALSLSTRRLQVTGTDQKGEEALTDAAILGAEKLLTAEGVERQLTADGLVHPGQTLYTPPGEEHWHAAAPGCFMEHIAKLQNGEDPATTTTWGEHITGDEYNGN